jgi:hypothetical protein
VQLASQPNEQLVLANCLPDDTAGRIRAMAGAQGGCFGGIFDEYQVNAQAKAGV